MAESDSKPFGVVYVITNRVNGKRYVGQTIKTAEWRFGKHALGSQYPSRINRAIQKHGKENFSLETVGTAASRKELDALEVRFINELQTLNATLGYNVAPGGVGNNIRTKEAAEKSAAKLRGRKVPRESVEKMAATKRGRPRTPAEQAVLDTMRAIRTGRQHTVEARQKMSAVAIGKKMPPCTDEHRKKLSDAAKKQWASGRGHSQIS
jgi:group I intron endonuclease